MIQNFNPPYSKAAKTAEIMSRFRPIAPKRDFPRGQSPPVPPQTFRQSPYLTNVWTHWQAMPTRTRKRGRTSLAPPTIKRPRTQILSFSPHPPPPNINININTSPLKALPFLGSTHGLSGLPKLPIPAHPALTTTNPENPAQAHPTLVTLPLLPCFFQGDKGIDLNREAEIPQERDFLQQMEGPTSSNVIAAEKKDVPLAPQPVRPVGSSISVGSISEGPNPSLKLTVRVPKKRAEEVEEEVELEALPAVVSDSNNKVRMANAAYKEMVGQPECSWLDCDGSGGACKRIGGEVMLRFSGSGVPVSSSSNGFSCWVKIEWGSNEKKSSVDAFSDVMRLSCESKDYLFAWRFHTS